MLDRDLADAYGVKTSQLKRQVRRNMERFEGEDFMFEVTREELSRCQIGTLDIKRGENIKYLPFAFTELGVAMLSSILRSSAAIKVNREIMRAFVEFRHMASTLALPSPSADVAQLRKDFEDILHDQNDINEETRAQLDAISDALTELQGQKGNTSARPEIGYEAVKKQREKAA